MNTTMTSAAERLRRAIDAMCRDPAILVEELHFGPPAPRDAIEAKRGKLPIDLLAFYVEMDGVDFTWCSRNDANDNGGIHVPPIAEATPSGHEFGGPVAFVLIDDLKDGCACYYEISRRPPLSEDTLIVYAQVEFVTGTLINVCKTFTEYLVLAEGHRFQQAWAGDYAVKRWHEAHATKK
jgi:hypothetical protein